MLVRTGKLGKYPFLLGKVIIAGICLLLLICTLFMLVYAIRRLTAPNVAPSAPGQPTLEQLEPITEQAYGKNNQYVPNSWGVQKSRIIRASTGDLFTVYISEGSDVHNRIWHLMHKAPGATGWQEIQSGDAGTEPINILRGPHDEIHLFAWPNTDLQLQHIYSTDLGKTFQSEMIPGKWADDQGYSSGGINSQGDIVFYQTNADEPGTFLWTYYSPKVGHWQFHTTTTDFRYTYAFFFPGDKNDLTITAMRDVKRSLLGYAQPDDSFPWIFNEIKYFHISNVNNPSHTRQQVVVTQVNPQNISDHDITYQLDSYIDTVGRTHILYNNLYDGPNILHHAIIQDGELIKDVKLSVSSGVKARVIQDAVGHFYIITMDSSGRSINVYPGNASDRDGTDLNAPTKLNISAYPGCTDYDFCHEPTFTEPRSGNALSNEIDGTYGNFNREIYFRIRLRSSNQTSASSPVVAVTIQQQAHPMLLADETRKRVLG
jgi:hypothetical protein